MITEGGLASFGRRRGWVRVRCVVGCGAAGVESERYRSAVLRDRRGLRRWEARSAVDVGLGLIVTEIGRAGAGLERLSAGLVMGHVDFAAGFE